MEMKQIQAREEPSTSVQTAHNHRQSRWKSTFWQFLRYCIVGGANTSVDLLVLNSILWRFPTNNAQALVLYNSIAYTSGAVSSFFLNKYWTFRRSLNITSREVVRFTISLVLELLYSSALMWLAGKALQPLITNPIFWGNASKLIATAIGTVISYSFMRFWTFAHGSQDQVKKKTTHEATSKPGDNSTINQIEQAHHRTTL